MWELDSPLSPFESKAALLAWPLLWSLVEGWMCLCCFFPLVEDWAFHCMMVRDLVGQWNTLENSVVHGSEPESVV